MREIKLSESSYALLLKETYQMGMLACTMVNHPDASHIEKVLGRQLQHTISSLLNTLGIPHICTLQHFSDMKHHCEDSIQLSVVLAQTTVYNVLSELNRIEGLFNMAGDMACIEQLPTRQQLCDLYDTYLEVIKEIKHMLEIVMRQKN